MFDLKLMKSKNLPTLHITQSNLGLKVKDVYSRSPIHQSLRNKISTYFNLLLNPYLKGEEICHPKVISFNIIYLSNNFFKILTFVIISSFIKSFFFHRTCMNDWSIEESISQKLLKFWNRDPLFTSPQGHHNLNLYFIV